MPGVASRQPFRDAVGAGPDGGDGEAMFVDACLAG